MLFNSYIFIFAFLPIVLILYYGVGKKSCKLANIVILLASFVFYGYYSWIYLILLLESILINYVFGLFISKKPSRGILIVAISFNVGLLFYFKYMNFFIENINRLINTDFVFQKVVLPLGISFFTFQQIAYLVECYKGKSIKSTLMEYALFVSFFPQLVAGPIALENELIPQFLDVSKKKVNWENISKGLWIFSLGLAKKVLLADSFGNIVNWGYENVASLGTINAILVVLAYTFEIYFDFSGYCDMASGIALMFNILLPVNFDSPYKALNIKEFWNRWHITLTRFLTQYIYIPIGGSKKGRVRTIINILVLFLLSGLWHGANWTFVLWGMVHGVHQVLYRLFKQKIDKLHPALNWLLLFLFVNFTWIYFRAESISQANVLIEQILNMNMTPIAAEIKDSLFLIEYNVIYKVVSGISARIATIISNCWVPIMFMLGLVLILGFQNAQRKVVQLRPTLKTMLGGAFLLIYSILSMNTISTFLYFNF